MSNVEKLCKDIRFLLHVVLFTFVLNFFINLFFGLDDSDKGMLDRSGLKIRTDAKTGLQYFETTGGGITPRLGVDGEHLREGE